MSEALDFKNRGNEAFQKEQYEEAEKLFTQAIALDPTNHVLYSNRSACYVKLNKGREALQDADKTVELKPDWAKGWGRKGAAHHLLGELDAAAQAYKKGLEIEPQNVLLRQGFQDVKVAKMPPANLEMFGRLFSGDVFSKIQNHPETRGFMADPAYVEKIKQIQADPSIIGEHIRDQRIMATFGMLAQASMGNMGSQTPTEPQPEPMHAETSESTEKSNANGTHAEHPKETAPQEVSEPEKVQPEPMETEVPTSSSAKLQAEEEKAKGNAAYKSRNFEEALAHYDAAITLDPTNIVYYNNKAAVFFEQSKYEECISTCLKGIDEGRVAHCSFDQFAKAYARIGNAYMKMDKLAEAIEAYNKSLSEHRTPDVLKSLKKAESLNAEREAVAYLDPQKSLEAKEKGNTFFKAGQFPEAVKEYTEAIKRNPKDPILYSNRAACYTKLQAFPEGLKDCDTALSLDPKFVKAITRKAHLLFWMKEYQKAIHVYREGLKLDPNNAEIKQGLENASRELEKKYEGRSPEERAAEAMKDPEIQAIMSDPVMIQILEQMKSDPKAISDHLKNPEVAEKFQMLVDAGIVQLGRRY